MRHSPDPEQARIADEVRHHFPGAHAWYGGYTGSWWVMVRDRSGRDRLVEAADPAELRRRLESAGAHPATWPIRTGAAVRQAPDRPLQPRAAAPTSHRRHDDHHEHGWLGFLHHH